MDERSKVVVQNVRQTTPEEAEATEQSEHSNPCVICLDCISERAVASPCRHHSFDFLCLVSWLQESPTCPLCKAEVEHVEYERQSPEDFKVYQVSQKLRPATSTHAAQNSHRSRLHVNRKGQRRRPQPSCDPNAALLLRRQIYRLQRYSLHVGSNRLSRFRNLNVELFRRDEELISRARKWIRRELQVFDFLNSESASGEAVTRRTNNAEFLLEYIIAILKTVDINGADGQAEDILQDFLGRDNARLFLHEMKAWLRSPYVSLEEWDRHVQYSESQIKGFEAARTESPARGLGPYQNGLGNIASQSSTSTSGRKRDFHYSEQGDTLLPCKRPSHNR